MNFPRILLVIAAAVAGVLFLPKLVHLAREIPQKIEHAKSGESDTLNSPGASAQSVNPTQTSSIQPSSGSIIAAAQRPLVFGEAGPVTLDQIPPGHFRKQLLSLPESIQQQVLKRLGEERVPIFDLRSLHLDRDGMMFYACPAVDENDQQDIPSMAFDPDQASVPISSPPARSSKPGSANVVYLDFNGHNVTGTSWNSSRTTFQCVPFDLDGDAATFNDYEQSQIIEVWERVAEDFKAFDINVTTVEPESFGPKIARALITKNKDATGASNPSSTAGGVAYKNVFGLSSFHTSYSPAFAYFNNVGSTARNIAEVVSHEVGHNLGLSHDGTSSAEYYSGHGTGEISWGAIMGASYGKNFTQWSKGEYYLANNKEDDIAIIAAKSGFAADDVSATLGAANAVSISAGNFLTEDFIIGADSDVDLHRIVIDQSSVTINAESFKVPGSFSYGSNLGVKLELLSSVGNLVAAGSSEGQSLASISTTVAPGTYYIRVRGTGSGSPLASSPTGFAAYGSMGAYKIYGSVGSGGSNFSPTISTENAASTTLNATMLTATVNPRGLSTSVFFQYGTSETFGLNSATLSAGSASSNATVQTQVTGLLPSTTYYFRAVAQNSAGTSYGSTQSFTTISNITALQSLGISTGTISPSFSSATRNYTTTVPFETTSLTANWTPFHPSATAQVRFNTGNFSSTPGGTISGNFALAVGNNTITIRVTAQDGATSGNHTLKVIRQRSADTALSTLSLGAGAFTPSFNISTSNYSLSVVNLVSSTTVNATKSTAGGKIEARVGSGKFVACKSGIASSALALSSGSNILEVKVTADNGVNAASYFFTINRAASGTLLSNLVPRWNTTNLTVSPAFSSANASYNLTVANSVSSITVFPTLAETNSSASARVGSGNFTAIAAGKASSALALLPGANTVQVRVLSDDKTTSRTYSLAVSRLTAPVANSAGVVTLNGTTLSGTIDARSVSAAFQIGVTSSFGTSLPLSFVGGNGTASVSTSTGALQASTLYYFRLTSQYGGITDNGTTGTFLTPVRTELASIFRTGGNATGITPAATFVSFGNPAINLDGNTAFYATAAFTGANATNNAGIWTSINGTNRMVARIGGNATGGGVFSALGEPVLNSNNRLAFIGTLKVGVGNVTKTTSTGIWQVAANGTTALVAKAGSEPPGAAGTIFSSFSNLVVGDGGVAFRATLASGSANVTTSNNSGIWAQNASGNLVLVARLGASPTPTLTSLTAFNPEAGQTGHSRHFNSDGDLLLFAKFGTGQLGVYKVNAFAFTWNGTTPVAAVGSSVPEITAGVFSAISNPILSESDEVAFKATFTGNGVTSGNNTGIFVYGADGAGQLMVRTGVAQSDGRIFQTISSPILNGAGNLAFTGALKTGVGGVASANATGVWTISPEGELATIARVGDEAPGLSGARFASFSQIAYPDEAGIAFTATLATGAGGVTTSNNLGFWAASEPGSSPSLIIRTGDSFAVGGVTKTISKFSVYSASTATAGASRSFNALGDVQFLLTFTDGTSGLFKYELP